jgi:hypothetical protein
MDGFKLFSLADDDMDDLDFSKGLRAFSIHSNHLKEILKFKKYSIKSFITFRDHLSNLLQLRSIVFYQYQ